MGYVFWLMVAEDFKEKYLHYWYFQGHSLSGDGNLHIFITVCSVKEFGLR